jgi:signal transduction histidine kinase
MKRSLITQLIACGGILFVLPLLTWFYLSELEQSLIILQIERQQLNAGSLDTLIQTNDALIAQLTRRNTLAKGAIYAHQLKSPVLADSRSGDWPANLTPSIHASDAILDITEPYVPDSLKFSLLAGFHGEDLALLINVSDDIVVYRQISSISVHRNDHIQLAIPGEKGLDRYTIAAFQPGAASVFKVSGVDQGSRAIREEQTIVATWLQNETGYVVEVVLPANLLNDRLAVAVTDVDDAKARNQRYSLGTSSTSFEGEQGLLLAQSPAWNKVIQALGNETASIALFDNAGYLVACHHPVEPLNDCMSLANEDDIWPGMEGPGVVQVRANKRHLITTLALAEADLGPVGTMVIKNDLSVSPTLQRSTNLLWSIVGGCIIAMLIVLCVYGFIVTSRLRAVRQSALNVIDSRGHFNQPVTGTSSTDEIGNLINALATVTGILSDRHQHLENLSGRLAHELRTPVTIVRSSLENLKTHPQEAQTYLGRAEQGIDRLALIINRMTEASRLEQSLDPTDQEAFDISRVVAGAVQGYQTAYPAHSFELSIEGTFDSLFGLPDLIVQMLDKLIANAVEFADDDTPIRIRLTRENNDAVLRVSNEGRPLPDEDIFHSSTSTREVVSSRQGRPEDTMPHLGLGLYIARLIAEFHGGSISAANRDDTQGVIVTVTLPIMRITSRLAQPPNQT